MKSKFSQRHPLLFGLLLIATAVVLTFGAMAFFVAMRSQGISWFTSKLGVVNIHGAITESRRVTDFIQRLQRDEAVEGVLVRIDSPGGVVAPSQEIHAALRVLAKHKPVVVSMGSVAASGGYYIACAADRIVANPGSITGSIGVKAQMLSFQKLLQRMGIQDQTVTSGKLKDAGSPTHPLTPEERTYFQELVQNLHQQFVLAVAQGRNMPVQKVQDLADGRAYSGQQARNLGLIDSLGGRAVAMDMLEDMVGISGRTSLIEGPEEPTSFLKWILGKAAVLVETNHYVPGMTPFSYIYTPAMSPLP